jgi:hypothetical protein
MLRDVWSWSLLTHVMSSLNSLFLSTIVIVPVSVTFCDPKPQTGNIAAVRNDQLILISDPFGTLVYLNIAR